MAMHKHPLHPAIVHFPIACWVLAVASDISSHYIGETALLFSSVLLAIGCITALIAMMAGMLDIEKVNDGEPLKDLYRHMAFMSIAFSFFTLRLLLGQENYQPQPLSTMLYLFDILGILSLAIGGWIGAKLVYYHGVGQSNSTQQN